MECIIFNQISKQLRSNFSVSFKAPGIKQSLPSRYRYLLENNNERLFRWFWHHSGGEGGSAGRALVQWERETVSSNGADPKSGLGAGQSFIQSSNTSETLFLLRHWLLAIWNLSLAGALGLIAAQVLTLFHWSDLFLLLLPNLFFLHTGLSSSLADVPWESIKKTKLHLEKWACFHYWRLRREGWVVKAHSCRRGAPVVGRNQPSWEHDPLWPQLEPASSLLMHPGCQMIIGPWAAVFRDSIRPQRKEKREEMGEKETLPYWKWLGQVAVLVAPENIDPINSSCEQPPLLISQWACTK